jgi:hypothetical protein
VASVTVGSVPLHPKKPKKESLSYTHIKLVTPAATGKSPVLFIYGLFNDLVNNE